MESDVVVHPFGLDGHLFTDKANQDKRKKDYKSAMDDVSKAIEFNDEYLSANSRFRKSV